MWRAAVSLFGASIALLWRAVVFGARSVFEFRRGLASLLLVTVWMTHYAYDPIASFYAEPPAAARAIFYVLRGFALGIETPISTGPYRGLCDVLTGWPIYMGTVLLVLLVFSLQYTRPR